ncbi:MAG: TetR/AcrR family transcriptional regulator [Thermoanaerobaculia bacterium]|nr:TetR/AcrR family transcriptional regulator [Thermoanaerobaculia bacterium]
MSPSDVEATPARAPSKAPTRKGENTRNQILETALRLFRERGYDGTTMRAVAEEAGVSLGSAYYYFRSKEHLIQAYYQRSHDEHLQDCSGRLGSERDLEARLLLVLRSKIDTSAPYHRFAGQLFRTASDPDSPLSPFSEESLPVRRQATELLQRVVEGSDAKVTPTLAQELPGLLWLYLMGIILFWVHDRSTECVRTYRLIDRTTELVVRVIGLASMPLLRPLVKSAVVLTTELRRLATPDHLGEALGEEAP